MDNSGSKLKRVLIVGGAATGWMAAAYLNRFLRNFGCTISLLESIKLGTSGVGVATNPALVQFVRALNLEEFQLMHQCSATYQLGARLNDWMSEGHTCWQPFGLCGGMINNIDLFHFWLKGVQAGRNEGPYSSYSLQALLCEHDKAPRPLRGPSPIVERGEYAYHLDPSVFADHLRELATAEGVNHLFDDVRTVAVDSAGQIERIDTKSGRALSADLYLDCTAEGLLIEQGLGDPWVSWSQLLPCDRSVLLPLPRDPQMRPYVRLTALSAGWMQHVPLSHRVACTYYYASAHSQDAAATRELLTCASSERVSGAEPRYAKLRPGRRQTFWLRNCVALGPAAGFVEPLQSTELLLVQRGLEVLVECFPDRSFNKLLCRRYNQRMTALHERVRDFVLLHYLLSRRDDSAFWREARSVAPPAPLQELIEMHDENGIVESEPTLAFTETSYHHLFAGAERLPRRPCLAADSLDFTKVCEILEKMKVQNADWLEKLPLHRDFLQRVHRPAV